MFGIQTPLYNDSKQQANENYKIVENLTSHSNMRHKDWTISKILVPDYLVFHSLIIGPFLYWKNVEG